MNLVYYDIVHILKQMWDLGKADDLLANHADMDLDYDDVWEIIFDAFFTLYEDVLPEEKDTYDYCLCMWLTNPVMHEYGELCLAYDRRFGPGAHIGYSKKLEIAMDKYLRQHNSYYTCTWHCIPDAPMNCACIEIEYFEGYGFDEIFMKCWLNIYIAYEKAVAELKAVLSKEQAEVVHFPVAQKLEVVA